MSRIESVPGTPPEHDISCQAHDLTRHPRTGTASTLSSWARAIARALDAAGIDSVPLLDRAGLDRKLLDDPTARYPQDRLTAFWRLAVEASGDETLGLKVSRYLTPTTFHALGFASASASTLREAFEQIERYFRVVSNTGGLGLDRVGEVYELRITLPGEGPAPADEAIDAFVSIFVRTCRSRVGRDYSPLRIRLRRPEPGDPQAFLDVFRCPVEFAADDNVLIFDRATLEKPLADANPELARHNEQVLVRLLAELERSDIRARVHAALIDLLSRGEPSAEKVAARLHMSLRSLQRKLAEIGVSYESLLTNTRHELALSYIHDARYSVAEITYLLGFSDSSSFSRAFRRWTGVSPSVYRQQSEQ